MKQDINYHTSSKSYRNKMKGVYVQLVLLTYLHVHTRAVEEGTLLIIRLMSEIRVEDAKPCQHKLLQMQTILIVYDVNTQKFHKNVEQFYIIV